MAEGSDRQCEVVVVGAGAAGMTAASLCARHGVSTIAIDEKAAPGGHEYRDAAPHAIVREFLSSEATFLPNTRARRITPDLRVELEGGGAISARRVIVATGARERPLSESLQRCDRVIGAFAAQDLLQQGRVSGPVVFAGTGPFLWMVAERYVRAGIAIAALLDTAPPANRSRARRLAFAFVRSPEFKPWWRMRNAVRASTRHIRDVVELRVEDGAIAYRTAHGASARLDATLLIAHEGLIPEVELLRDAGVELGLDPRGLGEAPLIDRNGETPIAGISVAGDAAGVAGAKAAAWRGVLLGMAAVKSLRPGTGFPSERLAYTALEKFKQGRRFLDALYRPRGAVSSE